MSTRYANFRQRGFNQQAERGIGNCAGFSSAAYLGVEIWRRHRGLHRLEIWHHPCLKHSRIRYAPRSAAP